MLGCAQLSVVAAYNPPVYRQHRLRQGSVRLALSDPFILSSSAGKRHTPTNGTVVPRRTVPHTISSYGQRTTYGIEIGVGSSELNTSGQRCTLGFGLGKSLVDGTSIFREAKHNVVILFSLSLQRKRTKEDRMLN